MATLSPPPLPRSWAAPSASRRGRNAKPLIPREKPAARAKRRVECLCKHFICLCKLLIWPCRKAARMCKQRVPMCSQGRVLHIRIPSMCRVELSMCKQVLTMCKLLPALCRLGSWKSARGLDCATQSKVCTYRPFLLCRVAFPMCRRGEVLRGEAGPLEGGSPSGAATGFVESLRRFVEPTVFPALSCCAPTGLGEASEPLRESRSLAPAARESSCGASR